MTFAMLIYYISVTDFQFSLGNISKENKTDYFFAFLPIYILLFISKPLALLSYISYVHKHILMIKMISIMPFYCIYISVHDFQF